MNVVRGAAHPWVFLQILVVLLATGPTILGQPIQGPRPFTIGMTRCDASIAPLILAQSSLAKRGYRTVCLGAEPTFPDTRLLPLRIKELDLLYTDGVSAIMSLLKVQDDIVFIAGALPFITGSIFASPRIAGFSDLRLRDRGPLTAVLSVQPSGADQLTLEHIAMRAILRRQKTRLPSFIGSSTGGAWKLETALENLDRGELDVVYVAPENALLVRRIAGKTKVHELRFGRFPFQGMVVAARRVDVDSNRKELSIFLQAFSEGGRMFRTSSSAGLGALTAIGLESGSAGNVYKTFLAMGAFDSTKPDERSLSNTIAELAVLFRELQDLDPRRLIRQ